jgi:uncharacterized protein
MAQRIFEWDEAKRGTNLTKHGLDFPEVEAFDWEAARIVEDNRRDYGEQRYWAFGHRAGTACVVVFTRRDGTFRIICFRRANRREIKRNGL